jgi:uncharacterized protein (DUF3820 family)
LGIAAKKNFHLWQDSPMVAHFDNIGGRVQIDLASPIWTGERGFPDMKAGTTTKIEMAMKMDLIGTLLSR